jgi:hypothetical protein
VPAFLASEDTQAQDRAAYAIQELLKFCNFAEGLPVGSEEPCRGVPKETHRRWMTLPVQVREIVHPYLKSEYKYVVQTAARPYV